MWNCWGKHVHFVKIFTQNIQKVSAHYGFKFHFTPCHTWSSLLIYMSALQGRGEINLKVSDLLTLVSESPHKMGALPHLSQGALRVHSTLLGISP